MTAPMPVRVTVEDAWDEVFLELPDGTPLSELKRQALELTHITQESIGIPDQVPGSGPFRRIPVAGASRARPEFAA